MKIDIERLLCSLIECNTKSEHKYNWLADDIITSLRDQGLIYKDGQIIPKLRESEDEKIRKEIIDFLELPHPQFVGKRDHEKWIAWLEKQGKQTSGPRYIILDKLIEADNIYQMSVNDAMVEEAKNKAIEALSKLEISKLLGLEKQDKMDMESYKAAEDEKREFVGDGFIKCYADFQDFKEGEAYWLEYIGNDNFNVRSDNLLGKTYHITPCQLYTIFKKMTWLEKQGECHISHDDEIMIEQLTEYFTTGHGLQNTNETVVAWLNDVKRKLEKQGSEPNWCHHKVDLSDCSEEYRKAYYDGWNNCNMQHSQCESEKSGVLKCLINGFKFYCEDNKEATWGTDKWSMPVKHIIEVLERKAEQSIKWNKNTEGNKPQKNHSVLIKTTHGISEGEWNGGKHWIQYRWSGSIKDSDVLFWIELSDIEKQGEQKPTDKVEPKFKQGEWIIFNGLILYVDEVVQGYYRTISIGGIPNSYDWDIDNAARLWTIQEAKAGDVLVDVYGDIGIFEERYGTNWHTYCYLENEGRFISEGGSHGSICYPATKEQRDLLFAKMKEASYEWDVEKKELKKIEPFDKYEGLTDFERTLADVCIGWIGEENGWKQYIKDNADILIGIAVKMFNSVQDAPFEQKPTWSEEDEKIRKALIRFHKSTIEVDGIKGDDIVAWLEKQGEKDKLIKELGEYKVKYTQEVLKKTYK